VFNLLHFSFGSNHINLHVYIENNYKTVIYTYSLRMNFKSNIMTCACTLALNFISKCIGLILLSVPNITLNISQVTFIKNNPQLSNAAYVVTNLSEAEDHKCHEGIPLEGRTRYSVHSRENGCVQNSKMPLTANDSQCATDVDCILSETVETSNFHNLLSCFFRESHFLFLSPKGTQ